MRLHFTARELATLLAALLYWKEELCPHGPDIMRPYLACLELAHLEPLAAGEIDRLSARLRALLDP
jgi:hypothetical protein